MNGSSHMQIRGDMPPANSRLLFHCLATTSTIIIIDFDETSPGIEQ